LLSASTRPCYPHRHVLFPPYEPGTTKTCTMCGAWNGQVKLGDKRIKCRCCGAERDRQIAGAIGNFYASYGMAVNVHWDHKDDRERVCPQGTGGCDCLP
jgi:hypothetical protein